MSRFGTTLTIWLLLAAAAQPCRADSPRELIKQGNEDYAAGRFAEALEAYQQAAGESTDALSAELLHNEAAAQFKLGNVDEARELWVRALSLKDPAFEARARYNLGNCHYADALRALESQDRNGVFEAIDKATQQYRDAIRLDPGLESARANLELAHQLKKRLEEQPTTQSQSQSSSTQQNDQQQDQSSQPSSQPQQGDEGEQDQQDQSPSSQPSTQQSKPQPESQPEESQSEDESEQQPKPQEGQLDQAEAEPQPVHMTREQAERLLQQIRDAEKARRRMLLRREQAKHKPVDRDW